MPFVYPSTAKKWWKMSLILPVWGRLACSIPTSNLNKETEPCALSPGAASIAERGPVTHDNGWTVDARALQVGEGVSEDASERRP
jgi:hypothetical protein